MTDREKDLTALRAAIESAFRGVSYACNRPEDLVIASTPSEYPSLAPIFKDKKWEDWKDRPHEMIPPGMYTGCLSFLQPDAFRYFLPIFLLAGSSDLQQTGNWFGDALDLMVRPKDESQRWWYDEVFGKLTQEQLLAVNQTIDFLDKHYAWEGSAFHDQLGSIRFSLSHYLTPRM